MWETIKNDCTTTKCHFDISARHAAVACGVITTSFYSFLLHQLSVVPLGLTCYWRPQIDKSSVQQYLFFSKCCILP